MQDNIFPKSLNILLLFLILILILAILAGIFFFFINKKLNWRSLKIAALISSLAAIGVQLVSDVMVPVFAPDSRHALFDPTHPAAIGIFKIKEDINSLATLLAVALIVLIIFGRLERTNIHRQKLFASMFAMLALFTAVNIVFAFMLNTFE